MNADPFHDGELAVQTRAGVRSAAERLGARMVADHLDADVAAFVAGQPFVVAGFAGADGRMWATALAGAPGFAAATGRSALRVAAVPDDADPLAAALAAGPVRLGVIVIEPAERARVRLNGTATLADGVIEVALEEVFGNCPKYITPRRPPWRSAASSTPGVAGTSAELDADQRAMVARADTAFVASAHVTRGADASHRGGAAGFLTVDGDGGRLLLPDYRGNNMFQTLGNLALDPRVGVLVVDWDTGRVLQVSGRAEVVWDGPVVASSPGAQRVVDIAVEAVVDRPGALPLG